MKKGLGCLLVIAAIIVVAALWGVGKYNSLVKMEEPVKQAWSNVENDYQRRADLIPNLVETVKGYAQHESETFKEVTEARTKATQIHIDADNLTEEEIKKYQEAQGEVGAALSRLIAVSEAYPELKANENFKELQVQLEGTENRIKESRKTYNAVAEEYNSSIRLFPTNIIANLCGFSAKSYFAAEAGAEKAPKVDFGTK